MTNTSESLVSNVKRAVDAIVAIENFSSPTIEISPGSEIGDGFGSKTLSISIKGEEKCINLFVKYFPEGSINTMVEIFNMAFHTEFRFYDKIFPEMLKFQQDKDLNTDEIFNNVPKHYKVAIQYEGIPPIILENLRYSGYRLRNFKEPIDHDHLTLAIKTYAKYHAISFAMKDQKPDLFKLLSDDIKDFYVAAFNSIGLADSVGSMINVFLNGLDPVKDKKLLNECSNLREMLIEHVCTVNKHVDEYAVICQGDCWSNNIMFRYDENNGIPIDAKLVDFQLQRYNSPVLDLSYFFYTVATKEVLAKFDEYIKLYYDTLAYFIKRLGSDARRMYPRVVFLNHWKKFAKFGLTMAFGALMVLFMNVEDLPNIIDGEGKKPPIVASDFDGKSLYFTKILYLIEHFVERDFL